MKKLILLLSALLTLATASQAKVVTGEVVSAENGDPLIGATVMVPGTSVGTTTDIDGKFSLDVPDNTKRVRVSYVGTNPIDITLSGKYEKVSLQETSTLSEVVVTGYGVTSKAAFTGAASTVDGAEIDKKTDVNFLKGMEGNVTGFQYNTSTSSPGTWGSVYVRGLGSLSSTATPLYVIDGIPVSSDTDGMSSTSNNYFDPMAAYNPNDIESVTVLKDAAATAIYGSRAANGVIVITTKRGAKGKFELNIDVKQGFSGVANNNMKFANAAQTMDMFAKGYAARTGYSYDDCYDIMLNNFEWDGKTDTNWMDAVTRKGYYQDYNVSFAGTSGDTHYYASLGFVDTKGIVINSSNKRYSGRVNLDTKYKFFQAGFNASLSYTVNNNFSQSTSGSMSNPIVGAMSSMTPMDPVYDSEGGYAGIYNYNPVAVNDKKLGDLNEVTNTTFVGNPWLRVDLPYGFWVKTNYGLNLVNQDEYNYWSAIYNPQGMDYNGLGQKYMTKSSTMTWTNTIGWDKTFNDIHTFNVLLGQEMQRYEYHYDYYSRTDFPFASSGMRDFATAGSDNGSEYWQASSRLASYFIDAKYALMDRYFFSASYRRDGSSVFGADNRWGDFWSVGAKWRISSENFALPATWMTNAALRISYGTVGNQSLPSLYAARGFYKAGYNYGQVPGMVPYQIANPDLSWETSRKFDVGFDFGIFNRANLTFDFYNEDTADALYQVPLSYTTGMSTAYKNIGKMRNTGIEVGINGVVFTNGNITVNAFANLSWNKNRIIKLGDGTQEYTYQILEEGRDYRQFFTPEYAGVDQATGKALYYQYTEDGYDRFSETGGHDPNTLTDDYTKANKRYMGSADPKVFGAFGASATGYGFDFSIQFNYRAGNKVMDSGHNFCGWGMSLMTPLETVVNNSWTEENPNALYPQYIYGDPYKTSSGNYSSRWIMDGSYIRLSNITLGYTLPKALTQKALMQKVRFYVTADNIYTWTKKSFIGYNPDTYANGVIAWQYPASYSFAGGVQITF